VSLKEELKGIEGRKRRFIILRVVGNDVETSRKLCQVPKATYNSWLKQSNFVEVYRKLPDLSVDYKQEAIQLLRRTTQLQAALLEEQIVQKMKEEIESGEYNLIKTLVARSVYDKIINSLDYQPANLSLSWEQKLQNIFTQPRIGGDEDGTEAEESETTSEFQSQPPKSLPLSVSE